MAVELTRWPTAIVVALPQRSPRTPGHVYPTRSLPARAELRGSGGEVGPRFLRLSAILDDRMESMVPGHGDALPTGRARWRSCRGLARASPARRCRGCGRSAGKRQLGDAGTGLPIRRPARSRTTEGGLVEVAADSLHGAGEAGQRFGLEGKVAQRLGVVAGEAQLDAGAVPGDQDEDECRLPGDAG